jgi:tetratricopeptide (TPR) repeat protein
MNALRQEGNAWAPADPKRAMELYGEGAAIARQLGNRRGLVELLRGMAYVADRQMLDKEAEQRDREILQVIQDESLSDKAGSQVDLAELLVAEGRLDEADHLLRQIGRGSQQGFAWSLCMGSLERERGEYVSAAQRIGAQVEAVRKTDDRYALRLALAEAFLVHRDQGDLQRAGADAQDVEKIRPFDPVAPYFRAELALSRGRWDQAEKDTSEAIRRFGTEVDQPLKVRISIVRAEALTGAGHPADALRVLDEIAPALDGSRRAPLQIHARVCRFRAQALLGSCPSSVQFQDLLGAAHRLGIPALSREVEHAGELVRVKCGTAVYAARR